jgi:hypothetical protein
MKTKKNILFYFEKCSSLLQRWLAVNSKVIGLIGSWYRFHTNWLSQSQELF